MKTCTCCFKECQRETFMELFTLCEFIVAIFHVKFFVMSEMGGIVSFYIIKYIILHNLIRFKAHTHTRAHTKYLHIDLHIDSENILKL